MRLVAVERLQISSPLVELVLAAEQTGGCAGAHENVQPQAVGGRWAGGSFMLESSDYLRAFMQEVARMNGGRVFYTSPEKLGEYILVDYVEGKRKKLGR